MFNQPATSTARLYLLGDRAPISDPLARCMFSGVMGHESVVITGDATASTTGRESGGVSLTVDPWACPVTPSRYRDGYAIYHERDERLRAFVPALKQLECESRRT